MSMPKWLENIVFYEVYPQSFQDTDGDGIGNIRGITQRLDYIQGLGCDGVWLNPCFESTFYDAGYDITDYMHVAKRYGTNEDLEELFAEAHKRGMKIILDLVPGHTSIAHPWFAASSRQEKNEFTDRYVWTDSIWNDFDREKDGIRGSIRGFFERNGCCAINFFTIQPALNYGFATCTKPWMQPVDAPGPMATREAMKEVMRYWMKLGCDGFRIDMAGSLVKNDPDQEATIRLWQDFRAFMDAEFPDCAMLSEWGNPGRSLRGGFHMDFLIHLGNSHYMDLFRTEHPYFSRKGEGDVSAFVETYRSNYAEAHGEGLQCIPSGNHDMARLKASLDDEEIKLVFAFLMSMPGVPFVYYGDEIGMNYLADIPSVEGGYHRTGARTPMQWDHSKNAGFSAGEEKSLYIRLDPSEDRPTAEDALAGKNALYSEVKKLIAIRKAHQALQSTAALEFLYAEPAAYPLVYQRTGTEETILIAINPSGREVSCQLDSAALTGRAPELLYENHGAAVLHGNTLTVPAASVSFLKM